jgi:hypothetical protein
MFSGISGDLHNLREGTSCNGAAWRNEASEMSKLVIFTISSAWDDGVSLWISAMTLDVLLDNHLDVDPSSLVSSAHCIARSWAGCVLSGTTVRR